MKFPTGGHSPRAPFFEMGQQIRWNSGTDGQSPDGREWSVGAGCALGPVCSGILSFGKDLEQ